MQDLRAQHSLPLDSSWNKMLCCIDTIHTHTHSLLSSSENEQTRLVVKQILHVCLNREEIRRAVQDLASFVASNLRDSSNSE